MAKLDDLFYDLRIRDLTDDDLRKVNDKLKSLGSNIQIDPKTLRDSIINSIPKGIKVEFEGKTTTEALQRAVEGKVVKVEIQPLLTQMRSAVKAATQQTPLEVLIAPDNNVLRNTLNTLLTRQGYMVNISTVTGLSKAIDIELNRNRHHVTITCDPAVISRSIQSALMNVQSRSFGLSVAKDVLYRSIDDALATRKFPIQIQVIKDQARMAVQNALANAANITNADALKAQRLANAELKSAQAELARLKTAQHGAAGAAREHASASVHLGSSLGSNIRIAGELGSAMASLYSIHQAKLFLSQVVEIGGELEHQKIALETIYGSGSKMESLYSQIKGLARSSPFGVMDLTKNIKQLSAYGVAYNEVYDTAKRLADISAATSVDINRLILAFGKTKNRTFLDGLEAKQFAYANIPIYDALSKKLTELEGKFVSVKDVMGRIKKREIGFDMVKDILWDMTDEGGKFYNMQEKLAGSVKTSWKLVKDNIQLMFGEIAESSVGGALKDTAEILQGLTRNWRTLAAVVGSGAVAFGVYRTAVLASNVIMGKATTAALQKAAAQRAVAEANAKAALSYRGLTSAEETNLLASRAANQLTGLRILSSKKLVASEIEAAYAKKLITQEQVLQLVALKRLTAAEAEGILVTRTMTATDIAAAKAEIARAAAAKKSTVIMRSLKASMAGLGATLRTFLFNPFTVIMAGFSAFIALLQRNSQEMEKAKEIGDGVFSKAVDGAKELNDILKNMKPSGELGNLELTQGVEQLENAIKDYSPQPIDDINKSLVTQDGHLRTLAERYDILTQLVKNYATSLGNISNADMGGMVGTSLKATDGGNWFTQLFDDNLETNAKDYTNALKRRQERLAEFAAKNKKELKSLIDGIAESDSEFSKAIENMATYEQKLKELITFKNGKYSQTSLFNGETIGILGNNKQIEAAHDELLSDNQKFIDSMNAQMRTIGFDPSLLTKNAEELTESQRQSVTNYKAMIQLSLKEMLNSMADAGDDAKALLAQKWEEAWGIVLMEDKIGPSMQEKFRQMANESTDEFIRATIRKMQYEGFANLNEAEQKVVKELMENAKTQAMADLSITNKEMADYLKNHPLEQLITLSYTSDAPSELAKELVSKHGFPGLTETTNKFVKQWTNSGKMYDSRNAAKESLQAAYSELEAAKREGGEILKRAQKDYDEIWAALQYLGWTDLETKDQKSNKHSGSKSQKDTVAEQFKQRFKDLKDAWSEYQKWQKSIGDEAAAKKIAESGLFGDMDIKDIPKTPEKFREAIDKVRKELESAGVKGHSQGESLLNEILKQMLDIDRSMVDEKVKSALETIDRQFDKVFSDYNLFEKIRNATGNEELAYSFSFGLDGGETDYASLVKKRFKALSDAAKEANPEINTLDFDNINESNVASLPEELQKAWRKALEDIAKYREDQRGLVADMLAEYQTTQEKIAAIDAKRKESLAKVAESDDLDDRQKKSLSDKINTKADYEIFKQSNEYLRFFNDIYGLTLSEANRIGDLIQLNLNHKLQAGLITIYEYEKEMEKVRKQLETLRNVKPAAMTYLTDGVKGVQENRLNKEQGRLANDSGYQKALEKQIKAAQALEEARASGDKARISAAEKELDSANAQLKTYTKVRDKIIESMKLSEDVLSVVNIVASAANGISDAFGSIKDMADSLGADTESGAWLDVQGAVDTLTSLTSGVQKIVQSAMSGDIGGIVGGLAGLVTSPVTIWAQLHDKKLQKDIDNSKRAYSQYENMIAAIERRMEHFLGNTREMKVVDAEKDLRALDGINAKIAGIRSKGKLNIFDLVELQRYGKEAERLSKRTDAYSKGGALGYQRQLMEEQLSELERQKADMEGMKKKDPEAIADMEDQIDELKIQIRDFAEEMANTVYGIDLSGWAEQIGDSLVDAFAKGEDAAKAFDSTASEIMRSLVSKMISQDIIAPMFGDLRNFLFGKDGQSGAYGEDFKLSDADVSSMKQYLDKIKYEGIPAAERLFNAVNEATGGMLNDTESAQNSLTAGIQGVTEDTAGLLASYVNAIRAYCAANNMNFDTLIRESLPRLTVIAEAQLTQLNMIAENTRRNMIAAEAMQTAVMSLDNTLRRATQSKDNGFYVR